MQQIKVYISAKLEHAPRLAGLRVDGFHINSRWIHMAGSARQRMVPVTHWQQENYDDIVAAHFFVLDVHPSDHLKGSLEELGYAIGKDKLVWITGNASGPSDDNWGVLVQPDGAEQAIRVPHKDVLPWALDSQRIRMVRNLEQAFMEMRAYTQQSTLMNSDGELAPKPAFFHRLLGRK